MLLTIFASITLGVMATLAYYLWRVPEGPSCPRCGAATRQADRDVIGASPPAAWLDRWTAVRSCPVCGWDGRQRRGRGPEPVGQDGRRGGAP